jgi:hypothetical protein
MCYRRPVKPAVRSSTTRAGSLVEPPSASRCRARRGPGLRDRGGAVRPLSERHRQGVAAARRPWVGDDGGSVHQRRVCAAPPQRHARAHGLVYARQDNAPCLFVYRAPAPTLEPPAKASHALPRCLIRCLKRAPTAPDLAPPRPASPRAISQTCRESGDPARGGPMPHTQQVARSNKPGDPSLKSPSAAIPRLNTRQHRNWVTEDAPRCAGWPVPRLWAVSRQARARAAGGRVAPPAPGAGATAWLRRAA